MFNSNSNPNKYNRWPPMFFPHTYLLLFFHNTLRVGITITSVSVVYFYLPHDHTNLVAVVPKIAM